MYVFLFVIYCKYRSKRIAKNQLAFVMVTGKKLVTHFSAMFSKWLGFYAILYVCMCWLWALLSVFIIVWKTEIIIIITTTIFMVLSSWLRAIARVHPVHLMDEDWAPGGRQPSDQANNRLGLWLWVRRLAATIHIHHRYLLLLLSPKADTHFTVPR